MDFNSRVDVILLHGGVSGDTVQEGHTAGVEPPCYCSNRSPFELEALVRKGDTFETGNDDCPCGEAGVERRW